MTRFNISLEEGVKLVFFALENALGGELYVPKIPSYRILDVAKAINDNCKVEIIGVRPGEKIHEEMISSSDSLYTYDIGDKYVILPSFYKDIKAFANKFKVVKVEEGFTYNSKDNKIWETVETLKSKIKNL